MTTPDSLRAALADRYTLERELGQGGMATVYLADDLRHERKVAVKVLRPELAASIGPERFLREIRIAAQLQHPHILPLLESGEAGGFLYYVMPYVDGQSLRDRLTRQGELPVHEAIKLISEVVDALSYAHGRGVVHRDIKPDNVMLSGRHALVMDFGVAKAVSEASGRNQLTTAGVALGTPAYMAPEQAAADPHLDHRVDIYAVGVMAYELLAGRPPFVGGSPQQVLAAHVTQAPEPVSKFRPGISPALEAAIMRCLAKRPADRWQSADELLGQLEPLTTPSGGITPTSTRPIEGWKPAGNRKWVVAGAAVLGAIALGATWILMGNRSPSRPPVQLDRTQLTYTGGAFFPAISIDGQRLAYVTHECNADGRCTDNITVQDVGGAGSAVILRGATNIWKLEWTSDNRFLLLGASFSAEWGVFRLSALGGEPLFLGCCEGSMVGRSDTLVMMRDAPIGDTLGSVRWMTVSDGVVHDSISVFQPLGTGLDVEPFPDGRHLVVELKTVNASTVVVLDRKGHPVDSLRLPSPQRFAKVTTDGAALIVAVFNERTGTDDLLGYPVDTRGHIDNRPDTVIRQLDLSGGAEVSASGMLVYGAGATDFSVWALTRDNPGAMRFRERRLAAGTANMLGTLSPHGDRVLLWREALVGDRLLTQLSVMPFDSGPETLLGSPRDFIDKDWTQDGRLVLAGMRQGPDTVVLMELDPSSGRSRPLATYPRAGYRFMESLPGGGYLLIASGRKFRAVGVSGVKDTTYQLPPEAGVILSVDPSPDGHAFVEVGWDRTGDSLLANRVSLVDGSVERLATFVGEDMLPPRWLADGNVVIAVLETARTLTWYRIPATGGSPVRLGSPPRFPAQYRISQDGRRVLMILQDQKSDIYLMRNFGEAFKR
jgi:tRNA A-37 threonylcarbamoyl transferase component Bud32